MFLGLAKLIVDSQRIVASYIVAKRSLFQGQSTISPVAGTTLLVQWVELRLHRNQGKPTPALSDRLGGKSLAIAQSGGDRRSQINHNPCPEDFSGETLPKFPGEVMVFLIGKLCVILCLES